MPTHYLSHMPKPAPKRSKKSPRTERARVDVRSLGATREHFWHNVLQEMLTGLSALSAQGLGGDLFDGRLAIITSLGQRIPIAAVSPVFACGVPGSPDEKSLSLAIECTIFEISTPDGEVFTLPLHEIRIFHALTEELIERVKAASREAEGGGDTGEPFGFAAFTSMAKQREQPPQGAIVGPGLPI